MGKVDFKVVVEENEVDLLKHFLNKNVQVPGVLRTVQLTFGIVILDWKVKRMFQNLTLDSRNLYWKQKVNSKLVDKFFKFKYRQLFLP